MGDFVYYKDFGLVRIDYICIHDFKGRRRLFIKATPVLDSTGDDAVLGDGYRRLYVPIESEPPTGDIRLVGLSLVKPQQVYNVAFVFGL